MVITLKQLLLKNENWYRYHQFYSEHGEIRPAVEYSINKIISCRHYARDHTQYHCSNPSCTHEKRILFSCKDRGCSACGKVATDNWLVKQKEIQPPCTFQHITFTMPRVLSDFFKTNRRLLNRLPALAGTILNRMAKKKELNPGIFMAQNTFGRKLNWNVHLHISVTHGGLDENVALCSTETVAHRKSGGSAEFLSRFEWTTTFYGFYESICKILAGTLCKTA